MTIDIKKTTESVAETGSVHIVCLVLETKITVRVVELADTLG